jgi:PAS domain S-box-containing protein
MASPARPGRKPARANAVAQLGAPPPTVLKPRFPVLSATPVGAPVGQADPVGKEDAQLHGLIDQLHQLITTLRNERAFLETVLHQMPAGVIIAEAPSGRLTMGNDEVEKIWGGPFRPSKSVEEYGQWIGFHADGRCYEPHEWPIARAIRRGEIVLGEEIRIQRFDGLEATVSFNAGPIRNTAGEIVAGVVAFTDITDVRRSHAALREQEQKLSLMQKAAELGYWELDLETGTLNWPSETYALMGQRPGDSPLTLQSFLEWIHPQDRAFVNQELRRAIDENTEYNGEFRIVRSDREIRWISSRGTLMHSEGKPVRFVGVAFDITERWRKEKQRIRKLLRRPSKNAQAASGNRPA